MGESRRRSRYRSFGGQRHQKLVDADGPRALSERQQPAHYRRRGGSNGSRVRLWKVELQKLADQLGLAITVCHLPPGTSKWNKACPREGGIEHRLFSFITMNWRGKPLVTHQAIVQLIAAATTRTGLEVRCELDPNAYPDGVKISDQEFNALSITRHDPRR